MFYVPRDIETLDLIDSLLKPEMIGRTKGNQVTLSKIASVSDQYVIPLEEEVKQLL